MSSETVLGEMDQETLAVWRGEGDYVMCIDGKELATLLQTLAAEYESGRAAYILEDLMNCVHTRLGNAIIDRAAREITRKAKSKASVEQVWSGAPVASGTTKRGVRWLATASFSDQEPANEGEGLAEVIQTQAQSDLAEFFLSSGSGDEWIDVVRPNGERRSGKLVLVDRGDRLEISFNAVAVNSREESRYVFTADADVNVSGELLIWDSRGKVMASHTASDNMIILDSKNDNIVRFGRVDAILATEKDALAADRMSREGCVRAEPQAVEVGPTVCTVVGAECFDVGSMNWEFCFNGKHIAESIAQRFNLDQEQVRTALTNAIRERLGRAIYSAVEHAVFEEKMQAGRSEPMQDVSLILRQITETVKRNRQFQTVEDIATAAYQCGFVTQEWTETFDRGDVHSAIAFDLSDVEESVSADFGIPAKDIRANFRDWLGMRGPDVVADLVSAWLDDLGARSTNGASE